MIQKGKNNYFNQVIWIGISGWANDKGNGCVLNVNIGFE